MFSNCPASGFTDHCGVVCEHTQDQLILPMALARGTSRIRVGPLSLHTQTAIHVAERMAGAKFTVTPAAASSGMRGDGFIIACDGIGFDLQDAVVRGFGSWSAEKKRDLRERDLPEFASKHLVRGGVVDHIEVCESKPGLVVRVRGPGGAVTEAMEELRDILRFYE